jgi:long-chain fatty acid transport protein
MPDGGNNGAGQSTDLGWGYTLGASYKIAGFKIGAAYDSAIDMKYDDQLTTQLAAFGLGNSGIGDHLEQPAQIKVGVAYDIGAFQIAADYKNIQWGDAKGYKDFGWENQNVYSLGLKFTQSQYWLAAGYNYGENPIDEQNGSTPLGAAKNFFNMALFPATSESHFTFGGGYSLTQNMALDAAIVYAPQTKNDYDTSGSGIANSVTTKHEEMSYTVQLSYKF